MYVCILILGYQPRPGFKAEGSIVLQIVKRLERNLRHVTGVILIADSTLMANTPQVRWLAKLESSRPKQVHVAWRSHSVSICP